MFNVGSCSVMEEISKTEEAIKNCYERVENLELKLANDDIPDEQLDTIERELLEVKKLLSTNEHQLKNLHSHNRKNFVFAIAIVFICLVVYILYVLVNGNEF